MLRRGFDLSVIGSVLILHPVVQSSITWWVRVVRVAICHLSDKWIPLLVYQGPRYVTLDMGEML